MPEVPLDDAYRGKTGIDYPKLQLKDGESARIYLIDNNADKENPRPRFTMEYTHFIKKSWYVGCTGNYDLVKQNGSDPDGCLACSVASDETDAPVGIARRRFACHVVRYLLDARGKLINPPAAEIVAWVFGDDKFNKLLDLQAEYNLTRRDLLVRCTGEKYQKFEITASDENRCVLLMQQPAVAAMRQSILQQLPEVRLPDLSTILCKKLTPTAMQRAIDRAFGTVTAPAMDIDQALEGVPAEKALGDIFGEDANVGSIGSVEEEVVEEAKKDTESSSIADILSGGTVGDEVKATAPEIKEETEVVDINSEIENLLSGAS